MSQHDFTIDNQGAPQFRADLNNALQALASLSGGDTSPATLTSYPNQLWFETDTDTLWIRNDANSAWQKIATFDYVLGRTIWFGTFFQPIEDDGSIELRKSDGTTLLKIEDDGDVSGAALSTQTQAEQGTTNDSLMTPLRTKQLVTANAGFPVLRDFTGTSEGYREIAHTSTSATLPQDREVGESFTLNTGVDMTDYEFLVISSEGTGSNNRHAVIHIETAILSNVTLKSNGRMAGDVYNTNVGNLGFYGLPDGDQGFFMARSGTRHLWFNAGGSNLENYFKIRKIYGVPKGG